MQTAIVITTIAAAVAYAVWRINDTLRHAGDPCRGCKLAENCKKKRC